MLVEVPASVRAAIAHGDVRVEGIAIRHGAHVLGYLQPTLALLLLQPPGPALSVGGPQHCRDPRRAPIEHALAANRADLARDAALTSDAASLCSLLLARGIDTRQFLEQIQQHPRAELLLIEAI